MISPIQRICRSADSKDFFSGGASLLTTQLEALFAEERSAAYVLGIFGSLALFLAAIGLYGIISYSVAQRTREFGIRTALGARNRDIVQQVISEGLRMAALGLVIGLACSAALSRFLVSRMHGLNPLDLITYAAISTLILAIASLASFVPARRAVRNPMDALRTE
ncbi:MAG: FtsX-like permease family protein [Acidobacteria bacterium]|nr:FtsX-like permease family protein [Acidobacteriota bacterium]